MSVQPLVSLLGVWGIPIMTVASVHRPSLGQGEAMNYNVRIALLFTVFFYIAQSIATQGVSLLDYCTLSC